MTNAAPSGAAPGQWPALLLCVGITAAAAAIGAAASVSARGFYADLARPAWAPPPSVFAPVWSALYLLMAMAAWLVWRSAGFEPARAALSLYVAQLALNALWTWLFFRWRLGAWALAEIVVLGLVLAATIVAFWRVRAVAGALLLPYAAWVTFAAALTAAVLRRNPGAFR